MSKAFSARVGDEYDFNGIEVRQHDDELVLTTIPAQTNMHGRRSSWKLTRSEAEQLANDLNKLIASNDWRSVFREGAQE